MEHSYKHKDENEQKTKYKDYVAHFESRWMEMNIKVNYNDQKWLYHFFPLN